MIDATNGLVSGLTRNTPQTLPENPAFSQSNSVLQFEQILEQFGLGASNWASHDTPLQKATSPLLEQGLSSLTGQLWPSAGPAAPVAETPDRARETATPTTGPAAPVAETPGRAQDAAQQTAFLPTTFDQDRQLSTAAVSNLFESASKHAFSQNPASSAQSRFAAMVEQMGSGTDSASAAALLGRLGDD